MEKDYVRQVVTERLQDIFKNKIMMNTSPVKKTQKNVGYLIPLSKKIMHTLKINICQLLNLQA